MIEADRADYSRAKLDHDLIVSITRREEIVMMLLEREDFNPNQVPVRPYSTQLSIVALKVHEGVARMLLGGEDINPNLADH